MKKYKFRPAYEDKKFDKEGISIEKLIQNIEKNK